MGPEEKQLTNEPVTGSFIATLKRNNKQIRDDRAQQIIQKAQIKYTRTIQDLEQERNEKVWARESMLDLSPTNAQSLTLAADFNADDYVAKDIELGVAIRQLDIKIEVARRQFVDLFGRQPSTL